MIKTYIYLIEDTFKFLKVPFSLHIRKKKFTILKIRHVTVRPSLRHKQCDVIGDLRIRKPSRT